MGKPAASKGGKKRAREAPPARAAAAESSSSGSGSGSESAAASSSSSSDEEESDSDDDEVEKALFRPAPAAVVAGESASSEEEAPPSSGEDKEHVRLAPATGERPEKTTKKKKAAKQPKEETEAKDAEAALLQQEVGRKTEATVYVEGIPYSADEGDVVTHFSRCGIVKEVRMPRYQDSGKPRGYAHVVFEDAAAVAKALKLDGEYLSGRYLTVRRAQTPRTVEMALQEHKAGGKKPVKGCRTVFIKQLPYDVEEAAVREALASCGAVLSVRLPLWNHTKKLKGFGYVEFASEEQALAATKRSGMKIGGRMVLISLDVAGGAPKASFRARDGQFWSKGEEAKRSLAKKMADKQQQRQPAAGRKLRRTS